VPLHDTSGKAIGELVASGALPLSIIDMKDFGPGGHSRFFNDFAPTLLRKMKGVVYLAIEEAHVFAPKERSGIGNENMMIHWAKMLATAGRSAGIRLIVMTQRTQSLHNAVLGSCETLIAHRFTTPADQKPIIDWLKANAGKEDQTKVASSLSSLRKGQGWICSGEAQTFELVQFPRIKTYDNSATPMGDGGERTVKTAWVDQKQLRAIIGEAAAEAVANDPKALKAKIAELESQLAMADKGSIQAAKTDPDKLQDAFERGEALGSASGKRDANLQTQRYIKEAEGYLERIEGPLSALRILLTDFQRNADVAQQVERRLCIPEVVGSKPAVRSNPAPAAVATGGNVSLTKPQRELLHALAWWKVMGHPAPTRVQLAAIAGWKPKGSNLRNRLSELSAAGLVVYPSDGRVSLTPAGEVDAPEPDRTKTLIDSIRAVLTDPQLKIFNAVFVSKETTRHALGAFLGWEPGGSNLRNRLSELSTLELVEYPAKGSVKLQDWVQ
jgi:hypothetical protein